jgi:transcription elongation factor GreA
MIKVPMTVEGAARLKAELQRLKTVERPAVIQALSDARSHGDLSENADYDAAKERQGFIEGRISEVESKLAHAQVIDPAEIETDGRVVFGATVEIQEVESGDRQSYQIVGDDEADIKASKISVNSPIARALIGKTEGDTVEVQAPGGVRSYEVVGVRYL